MITHSEQFNVKNKENPHKFNFFNVVPCCTVKNIHLDQAIVMPLGEKSRVKDWEYNYDFVFKLIKRSGIIYNQ